MTVVVLRLTAYWVEKVRTKADELAHELPDMKKEAAELLITFMELLIKFI
jgi:hypothetical protein